MCGIFGLSIAGGFGLDAASWSAAVRDLFLLSESRGKEAAGIALATQDAIVVHKDSVSAGEMLRTAEFQSVMSRTLPAFFGNAGSPVLTAIGHARLVTNGLQGIDANNQPVRRDDVVIVHNGIVVNVEPLWAELRQNDLGPRADVDTEVIAAIMQRDLDAGRSPIEALKAVYGRIEGETSVAVLLRQHNVLLLGSNTGSMHYAHSKDRKGFFFTSELTITKRLVSADKAIPGFADALIGQVRPGQGAMLRLDTHELTIFDIKADEPVAPAFSPLLQHQRVIEDKAERYRNAMKAMRRCSKCVLPETMPFISYDADGVCNYCHSYQPWRLRPEAELDAILDQHRSRDGSPDCIMAFSGGRDSSYGLHLLKTLYGMKPICFSYDWGMVTDLARRNQARMCGKLGVEHIWISADIKKKRANIRANVLAWLKKPDLGLIPLFMAGDKEFFMHANRLMKEMEIPLMSLCTNRYEKTEFKTGFLGIQSASATIHKPASLSLGGKVGMLFRYAQRFGANPAYLNRSIGDTAKAFLSYYAIEQNYFSMFDYVQWNENEINSVLIGDYDWELATDTVTTWRIGDGTAPFYNYIYWTVAGFTEADTFRSAQVREGVIGREKALELIENENRPRWNSIREYTQMINIDFSETIRIIDRIPKLYFKN
jgi:glutamine---fructose-6-phosphate transaminase (isomerizing)